TISMKRTCAISSGGAWERSADNGFVDMSRRYEWWGVQKCYVTQARASMQRARVRMVDLSMCRLHHARRIVANGIQLPISQIQALHLLAIEGTRAPASQHGDLISALVHGSIAINSLRHRQCA